MRRTAIAVGMLALLATACGAKAAQTDALNTPVGHTLMSPSPTTSSVPPATSALPTTPAPPTTAPPASSAPKVSTGPAVPPSQVDYSQLPDEYPHQLWTQDNGKTVVVMGEEGGCAKLTAQVGGQSAASVTIVLVTVVETHRMCPLYVRNTPVAVALDAPLGARKVVLTSQPGQH